MSAAPERTDQPQPPDRGELYRRINEGILDERLRLFRRNLEMNLPLVRRHGGLAPLVPRAADRHVVLVGAGPSLDSSLALLKRYRERREFCYVAVDMALRPLLAAGIAPALVFTCETTPLDFFHGLKTEGLTLAAFSCASPVTLRSWRGPLAFYNWMIHGGEYDRLWERAGRELGFVATGNTVTTQALSYALGCGPWSVTLVANDLGFTGTFYARGTSAHERLLREADRFRPGERSEADLARRHRHYEVRRGTRSYFTNHQFLAAKYWLEELLAGAGLPVYDTSEPGCAGPGITRTTLAQVFAGFERHGSRRR